MKISTSYSKTDSLHIKVLHQYRRWYIMICLLPANVLVLAKFYQKAGLDHGETTCKSDLVCNLTQKKKHNNYCIFNGGYNVGYLLTWMLPQIVTVPAVERNLFIGRAFEETTSDFYFLKKSFYDMSNLVISVADTVRTLSFK